MVKPSRSEEERGFQALLEEIEGKVKTFGEQVISLGQTIDRTATEFNGRLDALNGKVDLHTRTILSTMDKRFEDMMGELRALNSRFDTHERAHMG